MARFLLHCRTGNATTVLERPERFAAVLDPQWQCAYYEAGCVGTQFIAYNGSLCFKYPRPERLARDRNFGVDVIVCSFVKGPQ